MYINKKQRKILHILKELMHYFTLKYFKIFIVLEYLLISIKNYRIKYFKIFYASFIKNYKYIDYEEA